MSTDIQTVTPIPRQSLTSAVVNVLRDKILRGQIKAGEQLRQHAIAAELHVSRIPVREALRQLEAEGLVTIIDHRGAVVSGLSPEEILEMFEIRMLLESHLLRLSVPQLTDEDLKRSERTLKEYEQALKKKSNVANWGERNWRFHSSLYAAASRPRCLSIATNIHNNADRYVRLHLFLVKETKQANEEHREILKLCQKRDVEKACRALEKHIAQAGQSLAEYFRNRRDLNQADVLAQRIQ
jgi:DNA-binding GntR family transcriptional regulator